MTQLLITEAEAVKAMRLSARTLRKARKAGTLHYVLIGRAVRYTVEDLTTYIDSLRQIEPPCQQPVPKRTSASTRHSAKVIPFHRRNAGGGPRDGL